MTTATAQVPQINTIEDFLNWATELFSDNDIYLGHGTDNPWDEAVMLVLYVLQLPAENDRSLLSRKLTDEQLKQLVELSQRRVAERIPVPYLTNEAWFAGERYYVNADVLIPRSPLAETIVDHFQPWVGDLQPKRILDLCTGSGCLAILCAKEFPMAQVDAIDISALAIAVAKKNVALHECEDRVNIIQSDLFIAVEKQQYDIIISNPPYVGAQEMIDLPHEYLHEPKLALESGADGLDLTVKILQQAAAHLTPNGILIIEVGNSWHALEERFPKVPFVWLEFSHGGDGVFLLTASDLQEFKV